jgi:hypothetical protein
VWPSTSMGIYLDGDLSNPKFQNCHSTFFLIGERCVYILTYVCIIVSVYCVRAEVTSCLLCDADTDTKDPITPGKLRWSFKQVLINGDEEPFGALCLFCGHTFAKFYEGCPLEISRNLSIITRKSKSISRSSVLTWSSKCASSHVVRRVSALL